MRRIYRLSLLAFLASASVQVASAQIDVQSEDGNRVTIGPGGISIQKAGAGPGKTVNISPLGGISVQKGGNESVDISTTGINVRTTTKGKVRATGARTSVTKRSSSTKKTTVTAEVPLEEQVTSIEIQVYGKKTQGAPLLARIEKLEIDNAGQKGTGTLKARVAALMRIVGINQPPVASGGASVTQQSTLTVSGTPSVSITGSGDGGFLSIATTGGSGYIINDSGMNGTIRCRGENAVINASGCKLRFQGNLDRLIINGSHNELVCDGVSKISVNGSSNAVSWNTSLGSPMVSNNGSNNNLRIR